jgi:hypothetical protein
MQQKAIQLLNSDQKLYLMEVGMKKNKRQLTYIILIFVFYFVLIYLNNLPFLVISILFFGSILVVSGLGTYKQYQNFKQNDFPPEYLKMYLVASLITLTGIVVYAVLRLMNKTV